MSIYDQLLLSESQMSEIEKAQKAYQTALAAGDKAGMSAAHARAEQVRNSAGYSGGQDGSTYRLLGSSGSPAGYSGYEALVNNYATSGMNNIAAGYENTMQELAKERERIEQESEQNQSAARSSVWSARRLAQDGMLTRGLENTGLADVLTATTLNQASANAYQALLDRQNDLLEADLAAVDAKADALSRANELQDEAVSLLTDGYSSFYEGEAERDHDLLRDQLDHERELEKNEISYRREQALDRQDHQQELELAKLAHQFDIDLSKLTDKQKKQLAEQEYNYELSIAKLKRQWEREDR